VNATIRQFYSPDEVPKSDLPLFSVQLPAGYPTRIDCDNPSRLNIVEFLIRHPDDTVFGTVSGDSMEGEDIYDGDLLVIDRALEPVEGCVIVAFINGDFTVKKFSHRDGKMFLVSGNRRYPPQEIKEHNDFEVWGVVSHVIHKRI
jgi:DNA polymerase V